MADSCLEPLPWETRNLGVEAFGLSPSFLANPDDTRLKAALAGVRRAGRRFFVQARFDPDTRTSRMLEAHGFYFVEATVCPSVVLTHYGELDRFVADPAGVLPRRYELRELEVSMATESDTSTAAAIRTIAGESFLDDRFHVDDRCPPGAADRRYRLWVDDLFRDRDVRFHVLSLRAQPIAFMARRLGHLLLAGFARSHVNSGLGEFFWLRVLAQLRAEGVTRARTLISVNNIAVVNLYARLNFKFRDPKSTFHLWSTD